MDKTRALTRVGIVWRWFFTALVVVVFLVQTTTVSAHPADMFFQDHHVHLGPESMEIEWTIYPGPMLVYAIWQYVDQDADGQVSRQEASIWVEDVLSWISADIDESISLDLQVDAIDWPSSVEALQLGDELIIVSLSAAWPEGLHGSHALRLYDQHQESTSTFWFVLAAGGGVSFEKPVQQDGMLSLNIDIPAGEVDLAGETTFRFVKWDSGIPEMPASDGSVVPPDAEDQPVSQQPKSLLSESLQKVQNLLRAPALSTGFILNAILISLFLGAIEKPQPRHRLPGGFLGWLSSPQGFSVRDIFRTRD